VVVRHGVLRLTFADGVTDDVAVLEPMRGPVFAEARTPTGFATAAVDPETGTVIWAGGADLAPDTLYERIRTGAWPDRASQPDRNAGLVTGTRRVSSLSESWVVGRIHKQAARSVLMITRWPSMGYVLSIGSAPLGGSIETRSPTGSDRQSRLRLR
jgi:hypothetical protein